ncbi:MAG: flagellar hook-associated protein FlgK [Planctomycetota bacterium]|nr:MAG: flagellar hook-associated protein FlgK [Planctomycetota bacterium]
MSLNSFGIGLSGLRSNLAAIETVGHNIANANTEGYSRQRVNLTPRKADVNGSFTTGRGVKVATIERISDSFLEGRVRKETSLLNNLTQNANTMKEVEFVLNELSDEDLSSKLNDFFNATQDFANNVDDNSTRVSLLEQGESLASELRRLHGTLSQVQSSLDSNLGLEVQNANAIISEIANLNANIIQIEAGGFGTTVANDLRDKRDVSLTKLSKIMALEVVEESNGAALVSSAGQVLVAQGVANNLEASQVEINGNIKNRIQFINGISFEIKGGRLESFVESRDVTIEGFKDGFNLLAGQLIFSLNQIHSTGRGTEGLEKTVSEHHVFDPNLALNKTGYSISNNKEIFQIKNGSFDIVIEDTSTQVERRFTINVDLNGIGKETTMNDIVNQLNIVPNIKAEINSQKKLVIETNNSNSRFRFDEDSSNFLATMGIHSFFSGTDAATIKVNEDLKKTPSLLSGALSTKEGDNSNAVKITQLRDQLIFNNGSISLDEYYQTIVGSIAIESSKSIDLVSTHELILDNLKNLRDEVSGVSLDEEAANLLRFQRSYQASAQYIAVINEILETLIFRLGV